MGESIVEAAEAALKAKGFFITGNEYWHRSVEPGLRYDRVSVGTHAFADLAVPLADLPALLRYKETVTERDALWETLQTKQAALTALGEENTCLTKEVEHLTAEVERLHGIIDADAEADEARKWQG